MDTKKYLGQITWLNRRIQNKITEISQLRAIVTSATSLPLGSDKVMKSHDTDPMGNTIAKIIDKEREVDAMVDKYVEKRDQIINQIDALDDINLYHVLTLRYVAGKKMEEICDETGWSLRQANRLHGNALVLFEKRYGDTYK